MPFTPEEREAAFKRLMERYNLDQQGNPQPKEGIEPTSLPTAPPQSMVKVLNPATGEIEDMPADEAKKKGWYTLPPTR